MKKIKITVSLLLIMLLLCSTAVYAAEASSPTPHVYRNDSFYYRVNPNNTVTILLYMGSHKTVVIPSTLQGLPVTAIGDAAFMGSDITMVRISKNVSYIGNEAFANCQELQSVTFEGHTTGSEFQFGIFRNCRNLTTVYLPDKLEVISSYMFYGCTSLKNVTMPASLKMVMAGAFAYCKKLNMADFSATNLVYIDEYAYYHSALKAVYLPPTLEYLGIKAFANITKPLSVHLYGGDYPTFLSSFNTTPGYYPDTFSGTPIIHKCAPGLGIPEVYSPEYEITPDEFGNRPSSPPTSATDPISTEPAATQPCATEPPATEPSVTEPSVTEPSAPVSTDPFEPPVVTEPTCTEPVLTEPACTEPVLTDPVCTEPMATNPGGPVASGSDYSPGTHFVFSDAESFESNEADRELKADKYKKNMQAELLSIAWDVRILGDANFDGTLNIKDSTMIQKYVAKLIDETGFNYKNADVNTDGEVNVRDATLIQRKIAQVESTF